MCECVGGGGGGGGGEGMNVSTVKYLVSAHPPLKHKFLRKVWGGCLLGILPFVQSIIQPLKDKLTPKNLNSHKNPMIVVEAFSLMALEH